MDKVIQMPYLWTRSPKVHMKVVSDIKVRMLISWTFQDIWDEVIKSGIEDEDDQIVTTRALMYIRNNRRMMVERDRMEQIAQIA